MKKILILAFACGCLFPSSSRAMDLKQAKFTQVVNNVEVISAADKSLHAASVNDTFKMPDVLHTGPGSRTELVAEDGTITRVGANTIFAYDTLNRTIDLQQGSLLFHSPHGKGGGTIRTGSATASVIGTTIIVTCTPDGGFKLLDLEGETEVRFLNGLRQHLEPGQMTFILPGGKQPSPIIVFRLDTQSKGSLLLNGFDHPLPSIARIDAEVTRQLLEILNNRVGDTGLLVGNNATPNSVQVFQDLQSLNAQIHEQVARNNNIPGIGGNNLNGSVSLSDSSITSNDGNVTISDGVGDIWEGGVVTVIADNPIGGGYNISGGGDVNLAGESGNVDINNTVIVANGGDVSIVSSGGNIDVENAQIEAGDSFSINSSGGSITLNNSLVSGLNAGDISASTGLTVSGTSITADPAVGTISLNNASGVTTINNGSSVQAFYISVNSPDGILLDATGGTYSGNRLDLNSGNAGGTDEIDVQNADLTAFATVNMAAHTVNLLNVAFGGSSMVNLHSFFGLLADNPNTGAGSIPGYVNFINGVTYGGDPAENHVNPGSGPGIYISTLH